MMSTTEVVRITTQQAASVEEEQGRLKADLQLLRRRGAIKASGENSNQGRRCARCGAPFGRIYNTGAQCPRCRHRVCQHCRESRASNIDKGTAVDWLCAVCHKLAELHAVTGEWMYDTSTAKRLGRRKNSPSPVDILKRSIRRSWTINGPPTRWCATRRSPELRAYRSLPAARRRQDYRRAAVAAAEDPATDGETREREKEGSDPADVATRDAVRLGENLGSVGNPDARGQIGLEGKAGGRTDGNEPAKRNENPSAKRSEEAHVSSDSTRTRRNEQEPTTPGRVSLIKPPRVLPKFGTPDLNKPIAKHGERKSNIPVFRRSSREFEDIRSPQECAKRSLIPQRYRGSTDDLRRSREDISVPSLIPKLFSPRNKEDRLKRQDSKDEIRYAPKANRRDLKESKEEPRSPLGREDFKTGIKLFRRDSKEDADKENASATASSGIGKIKYSNREERQDRADGYVGEDPRLKSTAGDQGKTVSKALKRESREEAETRDIESVSPRLEEVALAAGVTLRREIKAEKGSEGEKAEATLPKMANERAKVEERLDETESKKTKVDDLEKSRDEVKKEDGRRDASRRESSEEGSDAGADRKNVGSCAAESAADVCDCSDDNDAGVASAVVAGERGITLDTSQGKKSDDFQVIRRKFSKEEFSNPDDTDDTPNRRCSSHLSPEASPLSTRSSRYSPRESESEPTPALPRKTGGSDSSTASQRIRDAITRTRRESNSNARYESSGSESVRFSEPGLHGYTDLAKRVKFGGSGGGTGPLGSAGDEVVQRDSATSAGEDEPHDDSHSRDPRVCSGSSQSRTMLRRRRQFDAQGSRRRGRSHARGCADELQSLQALHILGQNGSRQSSPPVLQGQGQEPSIVDYRRLVFISSDSSSGREEDDADSSSGSSSLNGLPRGGHTQGLEDCDWDYFESGTIPLPSNISAATSRNNAETVTVTAEDWSCCPGRGSSACQACGGARGANVLPVPVPIPVPVPYPVPIPAALWTSDFASASSMISCGNAAEGALRLRGDPSAPWFAWNPRFGHPLHGTRIDPRLTVGTFDPNTFTFRPDIAAQLSAGLGPTVSTSEPNRPSGESIKTKETAPEVTEEDETASNAFVAEEEKVVEKRSTPELRVAPVEEQKEEEKSTTSSLVNPDKEGDSTQSTTSKKEEVEEEEEGAAENSLFSFDSNNTSQNMYRASRDNSGSSSGRSSADSSDLEDSASHHFSRVFVVNDDSLTSDNDIEDNEDSDSAREAGGVILRRVSALPEDEPVMLRHVRLLDDDLNELRPPESAVSGDLQSARKEKSSKQGETSSEDSVVVVDGSDSDRCLRATGNTENRANDDIMFGYLGNFDPEANEIYLADAKDCSDSHIELKSVKLIDPDSIESPIVYSKSYRSIVNEDNVFLVPVPRSMISESKEHSDSATTDSPSIEENDTGTTANLSYLSDWDSAVVPDSLEVSEFSNIVTRANHAETAVEPSRISSDICSAEIKPDPSAINTDKNVTRGDKPIGLSALDDETLNSEDLESCGKMTSNVSNERSSSASLTGESSETTTGSEVSSDELHEYDVLTASALGDDRGRTFSAINSKLIRTRKHRHEDDAHDASRREVLPATSTPISFKREQPFVDAEEEESTSLNTRPTSTNNRVKFQTSDLPESDSTSGLSSENSDDAPTTDTSQKILVSVHNERSSKTEPSTPDRKPAGRLGPSDEGGSPTSSVSSRNSRSTDSKRQPVHSVGDIISSKIHEIFKNVENGSTASVEKCCRGSSETVPSPAHDESGSVRGERPGSLLRRQVGAAGNGGGGGGSGGDSKRGTARFRSVERRPPTRKDGVFSASAKDSDRAADTQSNFPSNSNKYRSLVMITQGAYQPVSVVTSDTTTLLQPQEEDQPPQGLAGYFQLALEAASEPPPYRAGQGPRRPLMVKRVVTAAASQQPVQPEPEVDSGLSVGSASESDDVQSVKSISRIGQGASGAIEQNVPKVCANQQQQQLGVPEQVLQATNGNAARVNRSNSQQQQVNSTASSSISDSSAVVILEEGLADDDSWVEEVSHDEDEQEATTATEESSEDEANNLGDREEELRGYHRQAIDFTLHTIVEESCEESEAEPSLATGSPRKQRPPSASELEKYFFFGLGEGNASLGSREVDSLSETSSIYSEGLESLGQEENSPSGEKSSGEFLNSSRLEKYFLSEFLGFDQDRRDSDGSVGSDSEGRPSPEQRRKRLVRARGTGRSHSSSLDNLLALAQSSQNLSSQNSLQDLSLNQDSQETQSEGSSTETDGADDQTPAFGTDGQFDTVKRKKKKPRNLGTQSPRVPEDRNKTPEPREIVEAPDGDLETVNSEDERSKTPQPESVLFSSSSSSQLEAGRGTLAGSGESGSSRSKQQSRDSGFIGSCDDLLQHQKASSDGQLSGNQDSAKDSSSSHSEEGISGSKSEKSVQKMEAPPVGLATPPNASLSRKDSFNNWSSDEETNLMMSKMRQFFKTMVANSNGQNQNSANNSSGASPAPSPRLSGSSPKLRMGSQNRTKPPQLVYFENELTRLMKTVPGIRDEQVREIVEYLSSEDTWSDSYDSSDYTSSDLEGAGAGGRRSALQEQISQSCQQIISKFDANATDALSDKEERTPANASQPLGRDTAFVYQKLVQSFTKMAGDGVSSDASSTPHSSPPLIAKVMHHIGSRLVALMHEVSEGGPAVQPHSWRRYSQHHRTPSSASTTEDDDSTSDSTNAPVHLQLPRSKSHDPLLLINGHPATTGQEGEEREASDYERFSWRGSFESALMAADSRTKLSLLACSGDVSASASASALAMAAKRRSAGDLLFNPKSFSREQLDRVRSCGSIGGGSGSIEEKIWSNRRRSSVPDANTRGESGASAGDDDTEDELEYGGDSRATTLPRGMQAAAAAAAATNSLPRLPATASPGPGGSITMHKAHSVHHFLPQHAGVKSARYRPPGFARNSLGNSAAIGPKRAVSAPGLQVSGSQSSGGKRENSRTRRQQTMSLTPDDGSSLSEACSTPIIGAGSRTGSHNVDDDMDRGLHSGPLATRASLSSLGARSDSMASVYSGAGEGRWCGSVAVRGEVEFALQYDYKQLTFEVHVTQCRDLAPVDVKRNRSDPYVKLYLLPDKSKSGKRKTKVKKHTLNPVFDETLKFHMSLNGLETRTLWLTVWHSDMFGRNDFLGEVRMPLENKIFDDPTPKWYSLQERTEPFDDPIAYKGEVIVGLKFVPPDPTQQQERELGVDQRSGAFKSRKNWSRGALHVLVKEARNLQTRAKNGGTCDPFCKSYLLPDKGRSGKQKTGVVRRCTGGSPVWGHTFIYKDVSLQELAERGLELTVWDHDRIASNEFLGGVRFNLGTGKHYGKAVDWMDATGRELSLWQSMLARPNFWVEGTVTLRPNLHNHGKNHAS